jgi:hypothetical protein
MLMSTLAPSTPANLMRNKALSSDVISEADDADR